MSNKPIIFHRWVHSSNSLASPTYFLTLPCSFTIAKSRIINIRVNISSHKIKQRRETIFTTILSSIMTTCPSVAPKNIKYHIWNSKKGINKRSSNNTSPMITQQIPNWWTTIVFCASIPIIFNKFTWNNKIKTIP